MESLALDKKQIPFEDGSGKKEHLPALHPKWLEKMLFVAYTAPPLDTTDRGQYEEWLERLKFIAEDLHGLLQLPHDKFWCQAVFNGSLHTLLDTYLRFAPRSYDIIYDLPADGQHQHHEVHRLIFMTCVRMATHKESKDDHITPNIFGEILYENFIFDVPKLLDLCVLYGQGNGNLLTKMITNIFTQQPKYSDDLRATIPTIMQVLDNIQDSCGCTSTFTPEKLGKAGSKEPRLVTMGMKEFQDVIFYVADTAITVSSFLDIYIPAATIFHEFHFEQRLAAFYEVVLPELQAALKVREFETVSHKRLLKQKLHQAKKSLQKIFHSIVAHTCIQPVLENSGNEDVVDNIEDFLHTMSAVLGERRFLADYESRYSFQEYADILCQTSCDVDETQVRYIHDAINSAYSTFGKRKKPKGAISAGGRTSPDGSPGPLEEGAVGGGVGAVGSGASDVGAEAMGEADGACGGAAVDDAYSSQAYGGDAYQIEDYDSQGACAPRPTGVELDSLITSVKDLLPDLGDGFIEILLEEFGYNLEQAINAVLTDKLPPSLDDIDRFLEREPAEEPAPSLLDQRANIYDNDQFDVFNRKDVDLSLIHQGKRDDVISLDDKTTVRQLKATYDAYGSRDQASIYDKLPDYDYDDEYDDTYDTHDVGAQDEDSADELTARRPFVVPRALQTGREKQPQQAPSEESEEEEEVPRDEFVQDPAKLREAAEQRRWSQANRGRGGRIRQQHDVVGKGKGQGQDSSVLRNRRMKEKNKAVRGNHNRRTGADRKRGRGMMGI